MADAAFAPPAETQRPYTREARPEAEAYMRDLTARAVEVITRRSRPVAVYMQGSFGRGEGTVRIDADGPRLWRDVDLVVVYRTRARPARLAGIRDELLRLPGVVTADNTVAGADISIAQLPLRLVRRWRDLKMLELATNSRHLAGHDVRPGMAVRDGRIPLESGERFLLHKAIGLCLVLPTLATRPATANYEVSKLYVELTSALALLEGRPSPSFAARLQTLEASKDPDVRRIAQTAAVWGAYKTAGRTDELGRLDAAEAWRMGRDDLLWALGRIHEVQTGSRVDLQTDAGVAAYHRHLSRSFLPRTVATALSRRYPPGPLARAAAWALHRGYAGLSVLRLGAPARLLWGCPLATVYAGAVALCGRLDPAQDAGPAKAAARPYFDLLGAPIPGADDDWANHVERTFYRFVKPLHGVK